LSSAFVLRIQEFWFQIDADALMVLVFIYQSSHCSMNLNISWKHHLPDGSYH
jgi:hypothetical protein